MDGFHHLAGWHSLGAFPDNEPDDVGSWLLHANGEAMLLEIPPHLGRGDVTQGLDATHCKLRYVTASHSHEDHFNEYAWNALKSTWPKAIYIRPGSGAMEDRLLDLGGEPLWLVRAPKHSPSDTVTIFRGVAMTGDIELGTLDSVNREVSRKVKAASMEYLHGFEERTGHHVHTIISAHLNDFRQGVNWPLLFEVERWQPDRKVEGKFRPREAAMPSFPSCTWERLLFIAKFCFALID